MLRVRNNIEKVMSMILDKEVYFALNLRDKGKNRFIICSRADNSICR